MKKNELTTAEKRQKAIRYYLIGLDLKEISKLLDGVSVRTLENWQQTDKWTEITKSDNLKVKIKQLRESGKTLLEIAELVGLSKTTVHRYVNE